MFQKLGKGWSKRFRTGPGIALQTVLSQAEARDVMADTLFQRLARRVPCLNNAACALRQLAQPARARLTPMLIAMKVPGSTT